MGRMRASGAGALLAAFFALIPPHDACADAKRLPGASFADPVLQRDVAQRVGFWR
jgi:hypothetical protein